MNDKQWTDWIVKQSKPRKTKRRSIGKLCRIIDGKLIVRSIVKG